MKRVLVIDDCDELREIVTDILSAEGFHVSTASSAEEGLARSAASKFDIILCDLVLPMPKGQSDAELFDDEESDSAMVGVHAIHELSRRHPKVPVIAISGELTGVPLSAMAKFGAVTTLSKPFGRDELLKAVNRAFNSVADRPQA